MLFSASLCMLFIVYVLNFTPFCLCVHSSDTASRLPQTVPSLSTSNGLLRLGAGSLSPASLPWRSESVEFVRYQWIDFSGILRQRTLTKANCCNLVGDGGQYGVGPAAMQGFISDEPHDYFLKQELVELRPDWKSLRLCRFAPRHAQVMCFIYLPEAADPLHQCARLTLLRALERCEESQISPRIGFEVEFVLLDTKLQPVDSSDNIHMWSTAAGLRDNKLRLVEEVVLALQESGIPVLSFHTEVELQLEFATTHFAPLEAVDALVYTHELLRCISQQHGMYATLAPRPTHKDTINTCHTHISVDRVEVADHFLAGILQKLPLLCGFSLPHFDSYFAVADGEGRAGMWIGYGTENRDLPLREISQAHFEYRAADCTANFSLFVAMLLHAGSDGVSQKASTQAWQDVRMLPCALSVKERNEAGLISKLPRSLEEAVEVLDSHVDELAQRLGPEMTKIYTRMKRHECSLVKMRDEERRLRYIRYF